MSHHGRSQESSGYGKFNDDNDDDYTGPLDARPCTLCHLHPMRLPHSVCAECLETKRLAKAGQ